ncbi:hypothetical protein MTO96_006977 [Rhipicephalus appendiculatus]
MADQQRPAVGKSHQSMLGETSPAGSLSPSAPSPTSSQLIGATAQSPLSPAQAQRSPGPVRMPSAPVSPLIQVSRVRPPHRPQSPASIVARFLRSCPRASASSTTARAVGGAERFLQPLRPPGMAAPPQRGPLMRQPSQDEAAPPPPPPRSTPPHTPSPTSRVPPSMDPYAQMPGTPRPAPMSDGGYHPGYARSQAAAAAAASSAPKMTRPTAASDPYAVPPGTPMPSASMSESQQQHPQYSPQQGYGTSPRATPQATHPSMERSPQHQPQPIQSPSTSQAPEPFGGSADPYARPVAAPRVPSSPSAGTPPSTAGVRPEEMVIGGEQQVLARQQLRDLLQRQLKKEQHLTAPPQSPLGPPQQKLPQQWPPPQQAMQLGMALQGNRLAMGGPGELGFRTPLPPGMASRKLVMCIII